MSRQTKDALFVYGDNYSITERGVVDIFVSYTLIFSNRIYSIEFLSFTAFGVILWFSGHWESKNVFSGRTQTFLIPKHLEWQENCKDVSRIFIKICKKRIILDIAKPVINWIETKLLIIPH